MSQLLFKILTRVHLYRAVVEFTKYKHKSYIGAVNKNIFLVPGAIKNGRLLLLKKKRRIPNPVGNIKRIEPRLTRSITIKGL